MTARLEMTPAARMRTAWEAGPTRSRQTAGAPAEGRAGAASAEQGGLERLERRHPLAGAGHGRRERRGHRRAADGLLDRTALRQRGRQGAAERVAGTGRVDRQDRDGPRRGRPARRAGRAARRPGRGSRRRPGRRPRRDEASGRAPRSCGRVGALGGSEAGASTPAQPSARPGSASGRRPSASSAALDPVGRGRVEDRGRAGRVAPAPSASADGRRRDLPADEHDVAVERPEPAEAPRRSSPARASAFAPEATLMQVLARGVDEDERDAGRLALDRHQPETSTPWRRPAPRGPPSPNASSPTAPTKSVGRAEARRGHGLVAALAARVPLERPAGDGLARERAAAPRGRRGRR